jgi:transposase-like protein
MPLSATLEDIKAYEEQLEKNKIKPDNLPPCLRCHLESTFFKDHGYRNRKFLIIVDMMVQSVLSVLLRFKCPQCGKTFTYYPDFALPYKRYTRQTVTHFSKIYVQGPDVTYQGATIVDRSAPGYPDGEQVLSPSTIHRFISSLTRLIPGTQKAVDLIEEESPASAICLDVAQLTVPPQKYRSAARKDILLQCLKFFAIESLFNHTFHNSIFTKLGIPLAFA